MKLYAQVTNEGTAMPETAVCETHYTDLNIRRKYAHAVDPERHEKLNDVTFHDCSGNDMIACLECGFPGGLTLRPTFQSPYEQHADRVGQTFTFVQAITVADETHDEEVLPMYVIRFPDGVEIEAWPEEIDAYELPQEAK